MSSPTTTDDFAGGVAPLNRGCARGRNQRSKIYLEILCWRIIARREEEEGGGRRIITYNRIEDVIRAAAVAAAAAGRRRSTNPSRGKRVRRG
jgi:hypothetical protein